MKLVVSTLLSGLILTIGACSKDAPAPAPTSAPAVTPNPQEPAAPNTAPPVIGEVKPAGTAAGTPTEPAAVDPKPAEPTVDPKPTEVAPAEPAPTEPAAVEPPVDDTPVAPEPVEPDKVEPPEPTDGEPADSTDASPGVKMHDIELADVALTNEIVDRMPDERRDTWTIGVDQNLLIWMEFNNKIGEITLESVWKKDGVEKWRFPFQVGKSKHWRTWVTKRIGKRDAGSWSVELVDEGGFVYHTSNFTISGE